MIFGSETSICSIVSLSVCLSATHLLASIGALLLFHLISPASKLYDWVVAQRVNKVSVRRRRKDGRRRTHRGGRRLRGGRREEGGRSGGGSPDDERRKLGWFAYFTWGQVRGQVWEEVERLKRGRRGEGRRGKDRVAGLGLLESRGPSLKIRF